MSRLISDILDAPEPRFSHTLSSWERISGQKGHDVRLISEIVQQRRQALVDLNLDISDTTSREFFYALRQRATDTNLALENKLKITDSDTTKEVIEKILAFIGTLAIPREVWVVKHSVVKELLKKHPPKKLLRILGLRSIDSVLKRISAHELLTLAYQTEPGDWSDKMRAQYKKLKPIDFQTSTSCIYVVEKARVAKLYKGGYKSSRIIVPNYETGTILIVSPKKRFSLDVLAITLALLQTTYDLRVYSAYFRLISVKNNFSSKFQAVIQQGLPGNMQETEISWRTLQKYLSNSPDSFAEIEQPHLQHEDVVLISPLKTLGDVLPDALFWNQQPHIFMHQNNKAVSMHLMDVVTNASNQLTFEESIHTNLQLQLWEELGLRYLQHETIRTVVVQKWMGDTRVYQICVSGAAKGHSVSEGRELAWAAGAAIATAKHALMTGATIGLPNYAAEGYKDAGGTMSVGISPAATRIEHVHKYRLPVKAYDTILYTGLHYVGRDTVLINSADAVVSIGGRLGTLHEFTIAMETKTPIGFLQGAGGVSSQIMDILHAVGETHSDKVVFSEDPDDLIKQLTELLNNQYKGYIDLYN